MPELHYDVFLSYAHADAYTSEQKKIVAAIKGAIEDALKSVAGNDSCVFLDSEALKWGDEWGARIQQCISQARVFVYLLSPNYLKSSYCQREKLWWAKQEIRQGRLNRSTRPVYYIELPETGDEATDHDIQELMICQYGNNAFTDPGEGYGKPFFASLDEVKSEVVVSRLTAIRESVAQQFRNSRSAEESLCTVYPGVSRYFVGRIKELADLNQLCHEDGAIPVISGEAGIGKSELAAAYAYAYAERFPQGRFLIPMEGVTNWTEAAVKMVDNIKTTLTADLASIGLPEDFDRLGAEKKRDTVYQWLKTRSNQGELLLLLDNLENTALISEDSILELTHQTGLPKNVRIIATTRLHEKPASSLSDLNFFELGRLSDKDAFELFCLMGDNCFPFAKWPLSESGELILDELSADKRPDERECAVVKKEYAAVKEIIGLLAGHAWSLEIVAGFMGCNPSCSFESKLAELRKDYGSGIIGKTHRGGKYQNPGKLLKPTLAQLLKFNDIDEKLGDHILFLAQAASFFPPEQVPQYALEGIWKQEFGNRIITWDGGMRKEDSCVLAMEQLKRYRIVNGDGDILKMHRLNREVLRAQKNSETDLRTILEIMRKFLKQFLSETPTPAARQLRPWCGWIQEAVSLLPELGLDETFFETAGELTEKCIPVDLLAEAEQILECFKEIKEEFAVAYKFHLLGGIHYDLNRHSEAKNEFTKAMTGYRKLTRQDPEIYGPYMAMCLNDLAILHKDFNRHDEAEKAFKEALTIQRELAGRTPEKYEPYVAVSLNNLANLHNKLNRHDEAEKEYKEALTIRRELAGRTPEKYEPYVAMSLNNLAILHNKLNRHDEAEKEYKEALTIRRKLARLVPEIYGPYVAVSLNNLAILHNKLNRHDEAEKEFKEALTIRRKLARLTPDKYEPHVAESLYNLAILHSDLNRYDEVEKEYREALTIFQKLAGKNPEKYGPDAAYTLDNLASLHYALNRYDEAEKEYKEALTIFQNLAQQSPEECDPYVATTLCNLANLHKALGRTEDAEQEFAEASAVAEKYPDNPACKWVLEKLEKEGISKAHGERN